MRCLKKCYPTRTEAKKMMKRLHQKNIYFCEECEHWHTTSIKKEDFRDLNKPKISNMLIFNEQWTEYSWENKESHPPAPGKYLIYREKCDKMHFEQWNGSGWASSNNDCTHWLDKQKPNKFNVKKLKK